MKNEYLRGVSRWRRENGTRKRTWIIAGIFITIYIATLIYQQFKPLPEGISYEGQVRSLHDEDIEFLYDLTYQKMDKNIMTKKYLMRFII
ncbi:hypothetical protein [Piscibacillus salipiscarius]|uniref:hypothetical protein n=1 Tax=Piscibacillus salipiscarius TaxID=299480 RepID=UPI0006CFA8A4|nr:hypothetical protein [Piscibacillus salipiscarius]